MDKLRMEKINSAEDLARLKQGWENFGGRASDDRHNLFFKFSGCSWIILRSAGHSSG